MDHRPAAGRRPLGPPSGLCGTCRHSRRIEALTGSVFRLCERSVSDPRYPRYPVLPVVTCHGFEPREPEGVVGGS